MSRTFRRVRLKVPRFKRLPKKRQTQAALNISTALKLADGPRFKTNLFLSLRTNGRACGVIRARNDASVNEMLDGCGFEVVVEMSDPFTTNHGGRPMDGYTWE